MISCSPLCLVSNVCTDWSGPLNDVDVKNFNKFSGNSWNRETIYLLEEEKSEEEARRLTQGNGLSPLSSRANRVI